MNLALHSQVWHELAVITSKKTMTAGDKTKAAKILDEFFHKE